MLNILEKDASGVTFSAFFLGQEIVLLITRGPAVSWLPSS